MGIRAGALTGLMNQPTGQTINGSLVFNGPQYLTRTPGTAGNRKSWTFSTWVKRYDVINTADSYHTIFGANSDGMELMISNSGVFNFYDYSGGAYQYRLVTSRVLRDPTAWFHVVAVADTTNSTASDRWRLYINGTRVTNFSTETYGSQNYDSGVNSTGLHVLGRYGSGADTVRKANVYLTNTHLIDGSSLDPSYFGFTDPLTNTWRPKKYTGTFGTNGFFLPMDNQDNFEKDKSGNGNDFTKNNFSGTFNDPDVLKDSPSGAVFGGRAQTGITTTSSAPANYATLNPLNMHTTNNSLSEGNLKFTTSGNDGGLNESTLAMSSGKFYFEVVYSRSDQGQLAGIRKPGSRNYNDSYIYVGTGNKYINGGSSASYGNTLAHGDIIGTAFDATNGTLEFFKNGVSQGQAFSGISGTYSFFVGSFGGAPTGVANFGQKPFKYAPPQGFLPLNSATVRPNKVIPRPDQYVGVTTYNGQSSSFRLRSGFSPDLAFIKSRTNTTTTVVFDAVRGLNNYFQLSETDQSYSGGITQTFNDGFQVPPPGGAANNASHTYVAYTFKAGGNKNTFNVDGVGYASAAAAGLTAGNITPTGASVGTKQGFSIIGYTGDGQTDGEVPHGLNQSPDFIIVKSRSVAKDWKVHAPGLTSQYLLTLNEDYAPGQSSWDGVTDTVFKPARSGDTYLNTNTQTFVAYCWHNVNGLQKFGSYTGNGDTDDNGPLLELGFRPAIILFKRAQDSGYNWNIYDTGRSYGGNPTNEVIRLNLTNAEEANYGNGDIDVLANGVKIRNYWANINQDGKSYIYAAWAEAPAFNLFGGQSNAR